jgi:hypothetical protein
MAFVGLRLLTTAVIFPATFGLMRQTPSAVQRRSLLMFGKLLQQVFNGVAFSTGHLMAGLNHVIEGFNLAGCRLLQDLAATEQGLLPPLSSSLAIPKHDLARLYEAAGREVPALLQSRGLSLSLDSAYLMLAERTAEARTLRMWYRLHFAESGTVKRLHTLTGSVKSLHASTGSSNPPFENAAEDLIECLFGANEILVGLQQTAPQCTSSIESALSKLDKAIAAATAVDKGAVDSSECNRQVGVVAALFCALALHVHFHTHKLPSLLDLVLGNLLSGSHMGFLPQNRRAGGTTIRQPPVGAVQRPRRLPSRSLLPNDRGLTAHCFLPLKHA